MEEELTMRELLSLLRKANSEIPKRSKDFAQAYKQYRMILSKELILEREKGTPVTILPDIVRGKENVANAKEQEIITEGLYKSCLEAINSYKLQIKILQERINKELEDEIT